MTKDLDLRKAARLSSCFIGCQDQAWAWRGCGIKFWYGIRKFSSIKDILKKILTYVNNGIIVNDISQ